MIVKMKFLSISGPRTDIDRVSASYLSKYEMQLENAITELKTTDNLMPFMDVNPYKEPLSKAEQYVLMLAQPKGEMDTSLTADEILTMIRDLNHDYLDLKAREDRLKKQKEELLEKLHELEPFQPLELNLKEVYGYQYMKVRFGRVNVEYYQIDEIEKEIENVQKQMKDFLSVKAKKIRGARYKLEELSNNFDVRKMAACMENEEQEDYYILCGWMSEKDTQAFIEETKDDDRITIIVEEGREKFFGDPPTKLQNPKFFKPFEMFIRMYGLPSHDEMDPTIFVALTYTFIFGAMFGDVGQGLCLFIGGGLLYKIKKWNLAGIISVAGIFSTFFGFMFGSFFGFEGTIIKPMWLSPMHAMMKLPFVGQLNTVFIVAVAFGMALILLAMVFQIINAKKRGDKENLFFSPNGVAGLVFYGFLVLTIVLYMTGHKTPGNIMMIIFLGIPVIMFLLKEPLGQLVEGKKPKAEGGVGMFLVQGFFELFETMLGFFSNTISFVRIGAFAVSHAAMMEVVLMLGGITDGAGNPNWIIIVLGNIIVCGLEGLVVGIQVLRLEYYEMFSRFYTGSGREFHPYDNHAGKEN